ncbi:MAG: putative sulfate exporter family transporter [Nitriliruptoraceae bacterium]|nr:putative sulfate exporter family transporter [Nitriliruptoraceae bacterium]
MTGDDRRLAGDRPVGAEASGDGAGRGAWGAAVTTAVPGMAASALVAVVAAGLAWVLPVPIGGVAIAVVLGIVIGQLVPRDPLAPGVGVATKRILRLGIVLLGARLSLVDVAQLGLVSVGLVVVTIALGLSIAWFVGRRVGLSRELSTLLGVGSAICGNTAIMASAPIIKARSRDVGLAVTTITLCGTVALLTYPWLGRLMGLDDATFGLWVGLAVQDTSQVVATGAAFSDEARDVATVVKLVRNTFLALVLPILAWAWQRTSGGSSGPVSVRKAFPTFVLGFIFVAALRTVGLIGDELAGWLAQGANAAILVAVAGLGLSVDVADLRTASARAAGVGALTAIVLGGAALVVALAVGPIA